MNVKAVCMDCLLLTILSIEKCAGISQLAGAHMSLMTKIGVLGKNL